MFAQNVKDIYFDYDKADIRSDQQSSLQADIAFLKTNANIKFTVEGHCDERGSTEYNLALGTNRAEAVKGALVQGGIAERIHVISFGKERPFCTESNEACWQQNRRGHFVYEKLLSPKTSGTPRLSRRIFRDHLAARKSEPTLPPSLDGSGCAPLRLLRGNLVNDASPPWTPFGRRSVQIASAVQDNAARGTAPLRLRMLCIEPSIEAVK